MTDRNELLSTGAASFFLEAQSSENRAFSIRLALPIRPGFQARGNIQH